jgi:hypothetical protein
MKTVRFLLVLAILSIALAVPVAADGPDGDVVIWGDSFTLKPGEEIKGDLLVYGGNVQLDPGSQVDGDVTVFGGDLTIEGEIDGEVTVWGGNVLIESTALIRGKVVAIGGSVHTEDGADVRGDQIEGLPFRVPVVPVPPRPPVPPELPRIRSSFGWGESLMHKAGDVFRTLFSIVVMVVLGILVVVFIPRHTNTVAEMMLKAPAQSFLSGVAAFIVVPLVALALAITICLIPVSAAGLLVTGVGLLFGWIAAGLLLGDKILRALNKTEPSQVAAVALGMPVLSVLSAIPCVGWLIALVVLAWSLGAVIYSLFGTRSHSEPWPHVGQTRKYDPRMDKL